MAADWLEQMDHGSRLDKAIVLCLFLKRLLLGLIKLAETSVLSIPRTLATITASLLHCLLSVVTSLNSASFIPVTSCISSVHLFLGRPHLLFPSSNASIIPFSIHLIA